MDYKFLAKILLVGNSGVGKTSLMLRFTNDQFSLNHIPTIGVDYKMKKVEIEGERVNLQLWDTAGTEVYNTITRSFFRSAHGILLCYSVDDANSFNQVSGWIKQITQCSPENIQIILVGNKCELKEEDRLISFEQGEKLALSYGLGFKEVSAFEGINVEEAFGTLVRNIMINKGQLNGVLDGRDCKLSKNEGKVQKKYTCGC